MEGQTDNMKTPKQAVCKGVSGWEGVCVCGGGGGGGGGGEYN